MEPQYMAASSTQNLHRPRITPTLWRQIRQIAVDKNISDSSAFHGVIAAGLAVMSGMNVCQMPPPPPTRGDSRS
jgi:hypothetical protein